MKSAFFSLLAVAITTSTAHSQTMVEKFKTWEHLTGRTATEMSIKWNEDRTTIEAAQVPGLSGADAILQIEAITKAQIDSVLAEPKQVALGHITLHTTPDALHLPARLIAEQVDIETSESDRGIIQRDSDDHKWLRVVDTNGVSINIKISSSPEVDHAERRARIVAASLKRQAAVATVKAKGKQFISENAAANNVPAMRAALVTLQEQVAAMQELLGIDP